MRVLIPQIVVFPYRLCDGGAIVLRAKFTLSLVDLLKPAQRVDAVEQVLRRDMVVDVFDPPQRAAHRETVMAPTTKRPTDKEIGSALGITETAVQNARSLHRKMLTLGLSDPYCPVLKPPTDFTKLRRHKHRRYRFEPLPESSAV